MNGDQGLLYVVMTHFARQLHPRAVEIEKQLDAGQCLSDSQIDHITQVLEDVKWLRPLIERHPEHRKLAEDVIALYAGIAGRGLKNETSQGGSK